MDASSSSGSSNYYSDDDGSNVTTQPTDSQVRGSYINYVITCDAAQNIMNARNFIASITCAYQQAY